MRVKKHLKTRTTSGDDSATMVQTETTVDVGMFTITPESKYRNESLDNLVRWMLMIFQKLGRAQCPICGSTLVAEPGSGVGKLYRCSSCKFTSVQTHCHACHNPIWKNSCYWSYNLYADNWANVRCPNCGACLGEPKKQHESRMVKVQKEEKAGQKRLGFIP